MKVGIGNYTLTTALGEGKDANLKALFDSASGLSQCTFPGAEDIDTYTGEINEIDQTRLPTSLSDYDCRNNRLALLALEQDDFISGVNLAIRKFGAERVGVILGTSTSGVLQTELAYQEAQGGALPDWYQFYGTQSIHSVSEFVKKFLGLKGYCITISTACSSSAKVFASAARAIRADICDAVIVGGVDSLCQTTLHGFKSLQLTSSRPCQPCDKNRDGISIGEAGGFALLTKDIGEFSLLGFGESADAHHMSSPHPEGKGAKLSMLQALGKAMLEPADISYLNLHGTGTKANDTIECLAVSEVFGNHLPCSSTKGFTGHTLGACGIVETAFCLLALANQFLPGNLNLEFQDSDIKANIVATRRKATIDRAMTNSFGFGGNNCSLILGVTR